MCLKIRLDAQEAGRFGIGFGSMRWERRHVKRPFSIKLSFTSLILITVGLFLASVALAQDDDTTSPGTINAAKSSDYDQAIADFTQAIQKNPQNAQTYFQRAFVYMETGEDDKAIADLSQAIQIDPQFDKAYFRRSFIYMMKGSYDLAAADLNQAIQINPQFMKAYYRRACVYMMLGNDDQAITDLTKTIQINPSFAMAYLRRSYAYMLKGAYAQAITELDQFIQSHPNGAAAYNRLAWLLATCPQASFRDGKKAVEDATKACDISGWKVSANLDTLAAAYAESGDFINAVKWENEAISNQSDEKIAGDQKSRRALYENYKPYHVDKYDPKFNAVVN
jgi:tetratricopeptide (TPR) repeat protein